MERVLRKARYNVLTYRKVSLAQIYRAGAQENTDRSVKNFSVVYCLFIWHLDIKWHYFLTTFLFRNQSLPSTWISYCFVLCHILQQSQTKCNNAVVAWQRWTFLVMAKRNSVLLLHSFTTGRLVEVELQLVFLIILSRLQLCNIE